MSLFLPDGNKVAHAYINDTGGGVHIYEWFNGKWNQTDDVLPYGNQLSFSANGTRLAIAKGETGSSEKTINVYDEVNDNWIDVGNTLSFSDIYYEMNPFCLSANGNHLAFKGDGKAYIYKLDNNEWGLQGDIFSAPSSDRLAINGDGTRIVIGNYSDNAGKGSIKIYDWDGISWKITGDEILGDFEWSGLGFNVSISYDGLRIAVTSLQREIKVYDLSTITSDNTFFTDYDINLYPNPVNEQLAIDLNGSHKNIILSIVDVTGKIFYNQEFQHTNKIKINISNILADGIYFATLHIPYAKTTTFKIIKQ